MRFGLNEMRPTGQVLVGIQSKLAYHFPRGKFDLRSLQRSSVTPSVAKRKLNKAKNPSPFTGGRGRCLLYQETLMDIGYERPLGPSQFELPTS